MSAVVGTRLADRYRLESRIAGGGMGEVWKARDEVLERTVAVKMLRAEYADDHEFLERFRDEAKHAAALSHPGIASVYDYGEDADTGAPYLVMEYVEGEPLSALLVRAGGSLSVNQAMDVVGQTALALQAAHDAGIVHRDVKPGNILVRPDGLVKVTDFGIARASGKVGLTRTGNVVGTAHYMSPEQAQGRSATPASDVYALGVVAYEALAGRKPFIGDSPVGIAVAHTREEAPTLPPEVPESVRDLVGQAMSKNPKGRPRSAGDLGRSALALAGDPTATTVVRRSPTARTSPPDLVGPQTQVQPVAERSGQRRVRNRMIAVGAVVVLVGGLLLWLLTPGRAQLPDVTKMQVAKARTVLENADLHVATKTVHDASHPAGFVLEEQPAAGSSVDKGGTVHLLVASGPQPVTVDKAKYVGQPISQVAPALHQLGLDVAQRTAPSTQPTGTVLDITPTGRMHEGDKVTVTVSTAIAPAPAPAPDPGKKKGHEGGKGHG